MKQIITDYTFNKTTRQITLNGFTEIRLEQFLLITNITDNVIIYSFSDPGYGGTAAGNVLTLDYDTSAMDSTDQLQILYDPGISQLPVGASTEALQQEEINLIRQLIRAATYTRDSADRLRVIVDSQAQSYVYTRNSGTQINASTEGWYSANSWNAVDAREPLMAINASNVINAMQKWRIQ